MSLNGSYRLAVNFRSQVLALSQSSTYILAVDRRIQVESVHGLEDTARVFQGSEFRGIGDKSISFEAESGRSNRGKINTSESVRSDVSVVKILGYSYADTEDRSRFDDGYERGKQHR